MKTQQTKAPQKFCHDDSKLPTCYKWNSNPISLSLSRITIILISIILSGTMSSCASKEERLIDALKSTECIKAGELIREGANINTKTKDEWPLILSVQSCPNLVPEILDKGADVNIKDNGSQTPLMLAIQSNNVEATKMLLDKGADVNIKNFTGVALHYAIIYRDIETAKMLLDKGADVNIENIEGDTPLMFAVKKLYIETINKADLETTKMILKMLLDKGADVNIKNINGATPLMPAVFNGDIETTKMLLDKGADVNIENIEGDTPLMFAVKKLYIETINKADLETTKMILKMLLDKGADVNIKNISGFTPLMFAVVNGDIETTKMLLDKGADVNVQDNDGNVMLHFAIFGTKHIKDIEDPSDLFSWLVLFDPCRYLGTPNNLGVTPLHLAIKTLEFEKLDGGLYSILVEFVEECYGELYSFSPPSADRDVELPFIQSADGNTILHYAAERDKLSCSPGRNTRGCNFGDSIYNWVSRFSYKGDEDKFDPKVLEALVRIQNKQGNTAKHLCYTHEGPEYCEKYFDMNLSAEKIKNNDGLTPRDIYDIREKANRERCHISSWKITEADYDNMFIENIFNAHKRVLLPYTDCFNFRFYFKDMNTSIALDGRIPDRLQRKLSESLLECYHSSIFPALGDTTLKERAIECNGKWF